MSNHVWWYNTFSFTCSLHFQWPWHYFKATAVSNSLNWKFYVLIQLSWNFAGLSSTSSRSWIYHYFWLFHLFKGDNWCVSWFDKGLFLAFFTDTVQARCFQTLHYYNLALGSTNSKQIWWPWPCFKVTDVWESNCNCCLESCPL